MKFQGLINKSIIITSFSLKACDVQGQCVNNFIVLILDCSPEGHDHWRVTLKLVDFFSPELMYKFLQGITFQSCV